MLEHIEKHLAHVDVEVRRQAVLMLNRPAEGEESAKLLLKAMQDGSWRVRKTAVETLIDNYPLELYITGLINLLYLEDNAGARNSAIEALVKLGKKVTGYLIEAFDSPSADIRKFVIDIIGQLGDRKAIPLLVDAMRDEDENVRAAAVEYLGNMKESSVVDSLFEVLEGEDLWIAYPAVDALRRIGDVRAVPVLLKALGKKTLREPVLKAIGELAGHEALEHVVPFITDSSKSVAQEALKAVEALYHRGVKETFIIEALRRHHGERLIEVLLEHAWSNKPDVSAPAILVLGLLRDERALSPLLELSIGEDFAEDVKKALVYIGKEKPESLLPLFRTDDLYLKRFLCGVVAEVASPAHLDKLIDLTGDEDGHTRSLAARGLAGIGDGRAIEYLKRLLTDPYLDVQESAVESLSVFGGRMDGRDFLAGLGDKNPVMRKNSALLLGRLGLMEALPALGFALKDENISVRSAVVDALSSIKTAEAADLLILALTDEDPDIRAFAALSLGGLAWMPSVEPLCLLLNDQEDMVRVCAAKALGALGDARALPALMSLLLDTNGFVVAAAIDSLGRLGVSDAEDALISMLSSEDREIRRTAIRALSGYHSADKKILPYIRDEDWATRVAAVESLMDRRQDYIRIEMERVYDEEEDPVVRKCLERYLNV